MFSCLHVKYNFINREVNSDQDF